MRSYCKWSVKIPHIFGACRARLWLGQFCWLLSLLITGAVAPQEALSLGICHLPGIPEKKVPFVSPLLSKFPLSPFSFSFPETRNRGPRPQIFHPEKFDVSHCDISSRGKGEREREKERSIYQHTKVTLKELQEQHA